MLGHFPHHPTEDQSKLILGVAHFLLDSDPHQMFVLKGYAGTGKTSLIGALICSLVKYNKKAVLLEQQRLYLPIQREGQTPSTNTYIIPKLSREA